MNPAIKTALNEVIDAAQALASCEYRGCDTFHTRAALSLAVEAHDHLVEAEYDRGWNDAQVAYSAALKASK